MRGAESKARAEKRAETCIVFLSHFRDKKKYARKRIPFKLAYRLVGHVLRSAIAGQRVDAPLVWRVEEGGVFARVGECSSTQKRGAELRSIYLLVLS